MASRPRREEVENSRRVAWIIGDAAVLVCLIAIGVFLLASHIGKGSPPNSPRATQSSQPRASATGSGLTFGRGASPLPTVSPVPTVPPASSPAATPTTSPSASLDPRSVPSSPIPTPTIQPSVPMGNSQLSLGINAYATPIIPGTYINLSWTPTVTFGSQIIVQDCQITWFLWKGKTLIDNATTSCSGTFELLKLPIGNYRLVGRVSLTSGEYAQSRVNISADCTKIGGPAELHPGR